MSWRLQKVFLWGTGCCVIGIVLTTMFRVVPRVSKDKALHCSITDVPMKTIEGRWIVIGTRTMSDYVTHIPDVPDWNVLVVHNINQPVYIQCRSCYCVDDETMQNLQFTTAKLLPAGHRNRKLIGYLFAVKHGAKYIYDIDHLTHYHGSYILEEKTTGIKYNATNLFNPFIHFGQPDAWSNDFPSDWNKINQSSKYYLGVWKTPLIQEQLDSVTALDTAAPPVFLGADTLALTSTQSNSLYLRDAFWALFRGLSASPITRILRGFWAQRLLWELGGTFGFMSVNNKGSRIYSDNGDIGQVVSFIQKWRCPHSLPFYGCVIKLAEDTIQFGAFSKGDIKFLKLWLNDLFTLSKSQLTRCEDYHLCESVNHRTVHPVQLRPRDNLPSVNTQIMVQKHFKGIRKICPNITDLTNPEKPFKIFSNILLILVFNYPHYYRIIKLLEAFYQIHFPNILYCGKKFANYKKAERKFGFRVSFIEVDVDAGKLGFRCLLRAIEMNYNVDGYLYNADDSLLNPWTLQKLDQKKIWLKFPHFCKIGGKSVWMTTERGYPEWMDSLRSMKAMDKEGYDRLTTQWQQNVQRDDVFYHQFADIAYMPQGLAKTFLRYAEHMSRFHVHVEITVPNVLAGMGSFDKYVNLTGTYLSIEQRKSYEQFYNKNHHFMHSMKIGVHLGTQRGVKFYCDTYFPLALKWWDSESWVLV